MNCSETQAMVSRYIMRQLSVQETEDFLNHIDQCQSCKDELETNFIVHAALKKLSEDEDTSMDFATLLDQDLRRSRHHIVLWRLKRTIMVLGILVAVTLAVIGIVWYFVL